MQTGTWSQQLPPTSNPAALEVYIYVLLRCSNGEHMRVIWVLVVGVGVGTPRDGTADFPGAMLPGSLTLCYSLAQSGGQGQNRTH